MKQFSFFLRTLPILRKGPSKCNSCTLSSQLVREMEEDCSQFVCFLVLLCSRQEELYLHFIGEMDELGSQFVRERKKIVHRTINSSFPSQTTSKVLPFLLQTTSKFLTFHNKLRGKSFHFHNNLRVIFFHISLQTTRKEYMIETVRALFSDQGWFQEKK